MANSFFSNSIYEQQHFSGTQASLYIGDVLVDEISSFRFAVQHTKTPIYGYASTLFDAVSDGPVIVTGSFTTNFKDPNYLYLVLMRYFSFREATQQALTKASGGKTDLVNSFLDQSVFGIRDNGAGPSRLPTPFYQTGNGTRRINKLNIEALLAGTLTEEDKGRLLSDITGMAGSVGLQSDFNALSAALEESIWGQQGEQEDLVRRVDDKLFNGFDMYFVYGDFNSGAVTSSVERINGVHITSKGKAVAVSGEPIQEEYSFIARDSW